MSCCGRSAAAGRWTGGPRDQVIQSAQPRGRESGDDGGGRAARASAPPRGQLGPRRPVEHPHDHAEPERVGPVRVPVGEQFLVLGRDRPVRRVAAKDVFVAYQPILEDAILPQPNDLYLAMKEIAEY